MENANYSLRIALPLLYVCILSGTVFGSSLRQYSTTDGLASPSVSSVFQDRDGLLWLGTGSGINTFDGRSVRNPFSGELAELFSEKAIRNILECSENLLWVLADDGLFRFDRIKQEIESFEGFGPDTELAYGPGGTLYAIRENNNLSYCLPGGKEFAKTPVRDLAAENVIEIFTDTDGNLWIITDDGNHRGFSVQNSEGELTVAPLNSFRHPESLLWCFYEDDTVYFVDATLTFYEYSLKERTKHYIRDIREEVTKYGDISGIIKHRGDYFVGFNGGGLLRIQDTPDQRNKYQLDEIPLNAGVLSLVADKFQDIVWVGTNGEGLYMYFNEPASLDAILSASLPHPVESPLTGIYMDDNSTLWIGSENNGMINIHEFDPGKGTGSRSELFSTSNSILTGNAVYGFSPSSRNVLWIATGNGINYYSYTERRIKNMQLVADGKPVKSPRAICELNDSTLWVATAGDGIIKARLAGTADNPMITSAKRFMVDDGRPEKNNFTVSYRENANTIWFGSIGGGAYKVNSKEERIENTRTGREGDAAANTVHAIYKNNEGYWFGTSNGLVSMAGVRKEVYNESTGLPCRMVYGILEDNQSNLWLATNRGVVKFNLDRHTPHLYQQSADRAVTAFTGGAYFKSPQNHTLFFGGAEGFVTINENDFTHADFTPAIHFTGLSIFGKDQNINQYLTVKGNKKTIRLNNDQNVFTVSFAANDFIDGSNYSYFYKLDGEGENWVDNGSWNIAFFTYLAPGSYTLSVKYRNNITGKESPVFPLRIRITPPWYLSWWAYIGYFLIFVLLVYVGRIIVLWRNRKKEEVLIARMNREFLNEGNKLKLQFFANMSNELYSPLTLILNPARKILSQPDAGSEVQTYTQVIRQNALRLQEFISDMSELRLLETGEKKLQIQTLPVSELADFIAESFLSKTVDGQTDYHIKIDSGIYWNTDSYCLRKIITDLLAHTFAHAVPGSSVGIRLTMSGDKLQLIVSGNQMNAAKEQLMRIFNHHSAVETIEARSRQGQPVREELILAICSSMIGLLDGEIRIEEAGETGLSFVVMLPQLPLDEEEPVMFTDGTPVGISSQSIVPLLPVAVKDPAKLSVLILSADPALCWLLTDHLSGRYNVDILSDPSQFMEVVKSEKYGLVIAEVNINGQDGAELVRSLKEDPACSSIPCILLASENTVDEKIRANESGAGLYLSKPFDMDFIGKEIAGMLQYKELQNYYTSALTRTFELGDEYFENADEKEFYDKMLDIIDRNLTNPELSVELICNELNCTSPQFYKRLKDITQKTPNEIIKEYRLNTVELLLVSTNLTVDEIIEKTGFTNRSNFFKVFSNKFGMTPRNYREQHKKKIIKQLKAES